MRAQINPVEDRMFSPSEFRACCGWFCNSPSVHQPWRRAVLGYSSPTSLCGARPPLVTSTCRQHSGTARPAGTSSAGSYSHEPAQTILVHHQRANRGPGTRCAADGETANCCARNNCPARAANLRLDCDRTSCGLPACPLDVFGVGCTNESPLSRATTGSGTGLCRIEERSRRSRTTPLLETAPASAAPKRNSRFQPRFVANALSAMPRMMAL